TISKRRNRPAKMPELWDHWRRREHPGPDFRTGVMRPLPTQCQKRCRAISPTQALLRTRSSKRAVLFARRVRLSPHPERSSAVADNSLGRWEQQLLVAKYLLEHLPAAGSPWRCMLDQAFRRGDRPHKARHPVLPDYAFYLRR